MYLSEKDKEFFSVIQLNADESFSSIAKILGSKETNVRRRIGQLVEKELLFKRPMINWSLIGLERYYLYFSMSAAGNVSADSIVSALKNEPTVTMLHVLAGDFQYMAALIVDGQFGLSEFFNSIREQCGYSMVNRQIANLTRSVFYGRKYLSSVRGERKQVEIRLTPERVKISQLDKAILYLLGQEANLSAASMARTLKVAENTVSYHLSYLKEKGVISAYIYGTPKPLPGIHSIRLAVSAAGSATSLGEELEAFASSHRNIVGFNEIVGCWDFELPVEAENPDEIVRVRDELRANFNTQILTLKSVQTLSTLKPLSFPFKRDFDEISKAG